MASPQRAPPTRPAGVLYPDSRHRASRTPSIGKATVNSSRVTRSCSARPDPKAALLSQLGSRQSGLGWPASHPWPPAGSGGQRLRANPGIPVWPAQSPRRCGGRLRHRAVAPGGIAGAGVQHRQPQRIRHPADGGHPARGGHCRRPRGCSLCAGCPGQRRQAGRDRQRRPCWPGGAAASEHGPPVRSPPAHQRHADAPGMPREAGDRCLCRPPGRGRLPAKALGTCKRPAGPASALHGWEAHGSRSSAVDAASSRAWRAASTSASRCRCTVGRTSLHPRGGLVGVLRIPGRYPLMLGCGWLGLDPDVMRRRADVCEGPCAVVRHRPRARRHRPHGARPGRSPQPIRPAWPQRRCPQPEPAWQSAPLT
jgi:hypothetical protein